MVPQLAGGQFTISINGHNYTVVSTNRGGWTLANRCGGGDCRGWTALRHPWVDLGGRPSDGDVAAGADRPQRRVARFVALGLPDYAGRAVGRCTGGERVGVRGRGAGRRHGLRGG